MANITLNIDECTPITLGYGALYNWYAATDSRSIANTDWHVPTKNDWITLYYYLVNNGYGDGGSGNDIAKSIAIISYWKYCADIGTPGNNMLTNNLSKLSLRPAANRGIGGYLALTEMGNWWTSTEVDSSYGNDTYLTYDSPYFYGDGANSNFKWYGLSIILLKDSTSLTHGQVGTYIGNNGISYPTICIGTQEWLSQHLNETKYRNGDWITGFDNGVYTPISNSAWAALTTEAMCYYNDDESNG